MGWCFDSKIFMVYPGHTGEYFCKISWQLDVCGQPVCILQMGRMLLEWTVNNICYTWLCGFNSQVRTYVLSYNLIWLFFGMLGSYINFMNWFLYGWVHNVFDDCIMCFGELCDGNKIFLVLRYRFWDECVSLW